MKISLLSRRLVVVALVGCAGVYVSTRIARHASSPDSTRTVKSAAESKDSGNRSVRRLDDGSSSAPSVDAPTVAASTPGNTRSAASTPAHLWAVLADVQGAKLEMNPAVVTSYGTRGETKGRSARFDAASVPALATLQPGDLVTLPLFDGEQVTGRVNLVQADAGGVIRVGGSITGERPGSFSLASVQGSDVEGTVLLPREGLALVIAKQAAGATTIEEKPIGEVLCTPMPKASEVAGATPGGETVQVSTITIPILSSRPSATAVIYLDFDGETVTDPRWNGGQTIVAAPANVSAADIQQAWASIKEDYWVFNIDVTTDVNRYNNAPANRRTRCIVTPTDTAAPGSGGVAYVNCFSRGGTSSFSATIPCWVFVGGPKPIAEAAAHEVGHTLGLRHDGRTGEEYYAGHGGGAVGWAPIMGVGYYRELVQWSRGEYPNASNTENDVAIISSTTNGFGYVADEAGGTRSTAALLNVSGSTVNQAGIVSSASDVDYYSVTIAAGGNLSLTAGPASVSPDLDLVLALEDANGTVLATDNPDLTLGGSFNATLGAGTYYVRVQGTGRGSVAGDGYSNYGSIGAYTLTGTIAGVAQAPTIGAISNQSFPAGLAAGPFFFTVADADTNVNLLSVSATSSNQTVVANAGLSLGGAGGLRSLTVVPALPGNTTITVTVSDGALSSSTSFGVTVTAAITSPAFISHPASQTAALGAGVTFTAAASGNPAPSYQWLKNGAPIAGVTGTTFSLASVTLGDAGSYSVTATNLAGSVTSNAATLTVNSGGGTGGRLTGTVFGSAPWAGLAAGDKFKAFDGDTNTSFDSEASFVYVGLDFGTMQSITRLRYFPRPGFADRMNGGRIRGANLPDLSDAVTIYTITSAPPQSTWQDVTLPAATAGYRYVFFTTDAAAYGNIAELELYGTGGTPPPSGGGLLTGTVFGSAPWAGLAAGDKFKAFDGDTNTSFDSEASFVYVGLDFGTTQSIARLRYFPRPGFADRMNGGRIRGANLPDLSDAVTIYTITSAPPQSTWQDVTLPAATAGYRYVFFTTGAAAYGNVAELEFYGAGGSPPPPPPPPPPPSGGGRLTGTAFGSAPWAGLAAGDKFKAFDGDTNTSFDSEASFVYVGLDFGTTQSITRLRYFPRPGFADRMNGGRIRGANLPDLSDAVTIYTITSAPPQSTWQDVTLPAATAGYRYVFFTTGAAAYGNIAELELYGAGGTPPPSGGGLLTGTAFGSAPWAGLAAGDKFKAFDGDTNTSFDSEASFIYVGLDFGTTQSITRLRYFPRPGFADRMNGGRIRGANLPDLSDAVTIYTITSAPPQSTWQDVTLPAATAGYRYVFFTTAAAAYGNIAELELYGLRVGAAVGLALSEPDASAIAVRGQSESSAAAFLPEDLRVANDAGEIEGNFQTNEAVAALVINVPGPTPRQFLLRATRVDGAGDGSLSSGHPLIFVYREDQLVAETNGDSTRVAGSGELRVTLAPGSYVARVLNTGGAAGMLSLQCVEVQ